MVLVLNMADSGEKPSVLIIGGLGYVGRFLALHIHKNNLASEVRLVDKVLPQLAWLAPEFAEACSQDKFMQADASRERELPLLYEYVVAAVSGGSFGMIVGQRGAGVIWINLKLIIQATNLYSGRISSEDIRSLEREAMGLRFQLWRRDAILSGG